MANTYAKMLKHSVSQQGIELKTFEIKFHRYILAEWNTHREFSRNFRSSRAVPVAKLIEEVRTNPAMPVHWGRNQPGMQAYEELTDKELLLSNVEWMDAANDAANHAEKLNECGAHKQIVNRILEPFLYVTGVFSSTSMSNFYALRLDEAAQPEIKALAKYIYEADKNSTPTLLKYGEWHLPYIDDEDDFDLDTKIKVSTARCARVSYKVFDEDRKPSLNEDLALYDKLVGNVPIHASPAEHQATPTGHSYSNFKGWLQHRKQLEGEYVSHYG